MSDTASVRDGDHARLITRIDNLLSRVDKSMELNRLLADRTLVLANSTNKLTEELLIVRQRLTEIYDQREHTRSGLDLIFQKLAVISKDVDDVEKVAREASGVHKVSTKEHAIVGSLRAFGTLRPLSQLIVGTVILLIALSGWFGWLIKMLGG